MDPLIGSALIGAAANIGGGIMSAQGQASANAANLAQQNMINQQMLAAQQAQHQQNTSFMEDQQGFNREERQFAEIYNANQAEIGRTFADQQAEKYFTLNTKWQEYMSNTAFQRSMADMKAAGLNPILAYMKGGASPGSFAGGGGSSGTASSPSSSSGMASASGGPSLKAATMLNDKEAIGRALGSAVASASDVAKTISGIDLMKAQEKETQQRETTGAAQARLYHWDAEKRERETQTVDQQNTNLGIEELILRANAVTAVQNARVAAADATASERYGGKYAPATWERILRTIQDKVETYLPGMKGN